jgi:DNA polymerase III subunit beta
VIYFLKRGRKSMAISISKQVLFNIVQKAFPIIPLKSSLQILSNFKIVFQKGKLEISATDLDQSMRVSADVRGEGSFDITVNARKIFEIIRELPEGMVTISVEDNVLLLDTEKEFNCKIAGTDSHDFPGFPETESGIEFSIIPSLLKIMIPKSSFAVAKDESRACLADILWEIYPSKTGMVATDGHRLGSCFINEKFTIKEKACGIISPKSLGHILKFLDEKKEDKINVFLNEKYVVFSTDFFTLCSKLIEGPYPDYNKVVPSNNPKEAIIERQALLNAVKRASVLSNQKTHLVKFSFSENRLEIIVVNKEIGGEAREKLAIEYHGETHSIGFNAQYLNEILDIIKTGKIKIKMNTQISACLVYPMFQKEEDKISEDLFLIMPLRIMET